MTISLTPEKIEKILHMVRHILDAGNISIRVVASCIGLLASSFPGVQFGPLYYRNLEICKNKALYRAKGDFDTPYCTISSVKSVLSALIHIPGITKISEHLLVKRLMTGIFTSRPTLPRDHFTWDTSIVINYLKSLNYDNLSHKHLSYKVSTLLTILSGQRVSTVHKFRLSQLHITKDIAIFTIPSLLKHTKSDRVNLPVTFHQYPCDDLLCPVKYLNKYISYMESLPLGDTDELIITFGKPYHPASKDTIAR